MIKKGEITIPVALAISCVIAVCGVLGSYYAGKIEATKQFGQVSQDIAVLKTSQDNLKDNLGGDVDEIKADVKDLNRKVDAMVSAFSIKVKEEAKPQ